MSSRAILGWQFFLLILLGVCLSHQLAGFIVKFYIDIFAVGRSDFKAVGFPFYLLIVLSFCYLKPLPIRRTLCWINIALLLTLGAFALVEYFTFAMRYFGPSVKMHAQFHESISSTSFYHIHNCKIVLSFLKSLLGFTHLEHYDAGEPYFHFYPIGVAALHSLVYVVFCLLALYQLGSYYRRIPAGLYALWVLAVFMLIKSMADGGPFFVEGCVAIPLYLTLQYCTGRYVRGDLSVRGFYVRVLACLAISGVLFGLATSFVHEWFTEGLALRVAVLVGFLMALALVYHLLEHNNRGAAALVIILCTSIYSIAGITNMYNSYGAMQLRMATQKIQGKFGAFDGKAVAEHIAAHPTALIKIDEITPIANHRLIRAEALKPIGAWQLANYWSLYLNDDTLQVDGVNCSVAIPYRIAGELYILEGPPEGLEKHYGNIVFTLSKSATQEQGKPPRFHFSLDVPGCTPSALGMVRVIFNDVGIKRSVIHFTESV